MALINGSKQRKTNRFIVMKSEFKGKYFWPCKEGWRSVSVFQKIEMKSQVFWCFCFTLSGLILLSDNKHFLVETEGDDESKNTIRQEFKIDIFTYLQQQSEMVRRITHPFLVIIRSLLRVIIREVCFRVLKYFHSDATPALLWYKGYFLPFAGSLWHKGGFHARKVLLEASLINSFRARKPTILMT